MYFHIIYIDFDHRAREILINVRVADPQHRIWPNESDFPVSLTPHNTVTVTAKILPIASESSSTFAFAALFFVVTRPV